MQTLEETIDYVHSLYSRAGIDLAVEEGMEARLSALGFSGVANQFPIEGKNSVVSIRSIKARDKHNLVVQGYLDELQEIYGTCIWFSARYEAAFALIPSRLPAFKLNEDIYSWIQTMRKDINDIHLNPDDRSDYVADACMLAKLSHNIHAESFVRELMQSEYQEVRDTCQLYNSPEKAKPEPKITPEITYIIEQSFMQNHPYITKAAIGAAAVAGAAAIVYLSLLSIESTAFNIIMHGINN